MGLQLQTPVIALNSQQGSPPHGTAVVQGMHPHSLGVSVYPSGQTFGMQSQTFVVSLNTQQGFPPQGTDVVGGTNIQSHPSGDMS